MKNSTFPSNREDLTKLASDADSSLTYTELSCEFARLYPTIVRAYELIGQMYNRLTLVDKLEHKAALKKIWNDHKHLPGFSPRNIYRYLPKDNPNKPKRIVPPRHKSSPTELIDGNKISPTKLSSQAEMISKEKINDTSEGEFSSSTGLMAKNQELEEALLASSRCTRANNLIGNEIVYQIPKEKFYLLTESMEKSDKGCFIFFDGTGNFVYAEADVEKNQHNVTIDSKNE